MRQYVLPDTDAATAATAAVAASVAAERAGVEVRELDVPAATAAAADLFCAIWHAPGEAAPVNNELMRALNQTGNYVAGAYSGDRLVGAAVAIFTDETPRALHSHICGVARGLQGRSVGFAIKLHQRAWALRRGIGTISWTADPLVRRNVYFNLAKLGATVTDYLPDYYGPMKDGVNAGDASDRLLLTWSLTAERVAAASIGEAYILGSPTGTRSSLEIGPSGEPLPGRAAGESVLRCELPADILHIRRTDPPLAAAWRAALRTAITDALHDGYQIAGVTRDGCYVLRLG